MPSSYDQTQKQPGICRHATMPRLYQLKGIPALKKSFGCPVDAVIIPHPQQEESSPVAKLRKTHTSKPFRVSMRHSSPDEQQEEAAALETTGGLHAFSRHARRRTQKHSVTHGYRKPERYIPRTALERQEQERQRRERH